MRRLLVHVGTRKTGSTSIQEALALLGPALRARGVHVPAAGRRHAGSARHANLLGSITGFLYEPAHGGWRELAAEIQASDAEQFVISDEALSSAPPWAQRAATEAMAALATACRLRVDVVGYVRPQCQYLESFYAQNVADGWICAGFETYAAEVLAVRRLRRWPGLDCARALAAWRAAFGDAMSVTPFERCRLPTGVVTHFLGLLGVPDLAERMAGFARNARIGARELEVRRLTALALRRAGLREPWSVGRVLTRLDHLPALLGSDRPFAALSERRSAALMAGFAGANASFARDYAVDADGVLFRDSPVDDRARPSVARWSDMSAAVREAVRDYVAATAGVDPAPAAERRTVPSRLDHWRTMAPVGSLAWRVGWLLDGPYLGRQAGRAMRRAWRPAVRKPPVRRARGNALPLDAGRVRAERGQRDAGREEEP